MLWVVIGVLVLVGVIVVGALVFTGVALGGAFVFGAKQLAHVQDGIARGREAFDTLVAQHGFTRVENGVTGVYQGEPVTIRHVGERRRAGFRAYVARVTETTVSLPPGVDRARLAPAELVAARALPHFFHTETKVGCRDEEWALDLRAISARLDVLVRLVRASAREPSGS